MKKAFIIIGAVLVIAVVGWLLIPDNSTSNEANANNAQPNTAQIAVQEVANSSAYMYDVRTPEEYNTQHVEGAINFNVVDMQNGSYPQVPEDSKIYVYCRSGNRSAEATQLLKENGYTNITDLGGLGDLKNAGVL